MYYGARGAGCVSSVDFDGEQRTTADLPFGAHHITAADLRQIKRSQVRLLSTREIMCQLLEERVSRVSALGHFHSEQASPFVKLTILSSSIASIVIEFPDEPDPAFAGYFMLTKRYTPRASESILRSGLGRA